MRRILIIILLISCATLASEIVSDLGILEPEKAITLNCQILFPKLEKISLVKPELNLNQINTKVISPEIDPGEFLTIKDNNIILNPPYTIPPGDYQLVFNITETDSENLLILNFRINKTVVLGIKIPPYSEVPDKILCLDPFIKPRLNCLIKANCDWDLYVSDLLFATELPAELRLSLSASPEADFLVVNDMPKKLLSGSSHGETQTFDIYVSLGDFTACKAGWHNYLLLFRLEPRELF